MKKNYQKLNLMLMVSVSLAIMLLSESINVSGATPKYVFGSLQNAPSHLVQNYNAGMRRAVLELSWSSYFPSEGAKDNNYVTSMKNLMQTYKNEGYDIMLDFGFQYAPSWVFNYSDSRFKNQYGDTFSGGAGESVVNGVFNNVMRQKQEIYVQQVFADLGTDIACVKIGWLRYGELGYPQNSYNGHSNTYWCYDNVAQNGGANLPAGITACPVPGWLPGQTSTNHNNARNFYNWYVGALTNYQNWMISTTRKYYQGQLCVLYPSWGTRPGSVNSAINADLNGSTSPEINGEIQRAHDFQTLVGAITDPNVMVYCTWIDSDESWSNDASSNSVNWCPVHWLANLAQTHSPALEVGGENTGGADAKSLDLTFRRLSAYNLKLLMWAFDSQLYDGTYITITQFGNYITTYQQYTKTIAINSGGLALTLECYPNPFNSGTEMNYRIPVSGNVSLKVYDVLGMEVGTLAEGNMKAGSYKATFDGSKFESSIFFARLIVTPQDVSKPFVQTLKLMKVK